MRRFEKLDAMLGRLVYRATGIVCLFVALICFHAAYGHLRNWHSEDSLIPTVLFGLVAIASACAVPYCFSRKRTFSEALDAVEGGAGDQRRADS